MPGCLRFLGCSAGFGAAFCAIALSKSCGFVSGAGESIPFILAFVVFASLASWLAQKANENEQDEVNEVATEILRQVKAGDKPPPFSLYLRPFFTEGRLHQSRSKPSARWLGIIWPGYHMPEAYDGVERLLERSLSSTFPLARIGGSPERIGGGKVDAPEGEQWQDTFALLATAASAIFVLPAPGGCTEWEIGWIAGQNLKEKTILIMPGSPMVADEDSDNIGAQARSPEEIWSSAQAMLLRHGFQIPDHKAQGGLFRFRSDGTVAENLSLGEVGAKNLNAMCEAAMAGSSASDSKATI